MTFIKKNKLFVSLLFILCIIILMIFTIPQLQGYLYFGDHINVTVHVYVNEKEINLDGSSVLLMHKGNTEKLSFDQNAIQTKGGEYGEYVFKVLIDKNQSGFDRDIDLYLRYINTNKWYISNSTCRIYLTSEQDSISGKSTIKVQYNDKTSNIYEQRFYVIEDEVSITWGN